GEFGKHVQPFVPATSCRGGSPGLLGQSMIAALLAISGGAALFAFAIFCASVIALGAPVLAAPCSCCACTVIVPTVTAMAAIQEMRGKGFLLRWFAVGSF